MISKRIKQAREKLKITQDQLALAVGTTKATISNYENEHSSPSNEMLIKLSKALNVSADYLLGIESNSTNRDESFNTSRLQHRLEAQESFTEMLLLFDFDETTNIMKLVSELYKNGESLEGIKTRLKS